MDEIFGQVLNVGFFAALIRIATPLILATIGELYAERSGVLNLGIEGTMLLGAMAGFSIGYFTGSLWLGVAAAMLAGMAMGLIMGLTTVTLGLSQHVSGIGVTLLATADLRPALGAAERQAVPARPHPAALRDSIRRADPLQPICLELSGAAPRPAHGVPAHPHALGA
jgi:hypothetical protein